MSCNLHVDDVVNVVILHTITAVSYKHCKNIKGKIRPRTDHEGPDGEYMYSHSLTSAIDGWVGG
jgi:hypothetical protein